MLRNRALSNNHNFAYGHDVTRWPTVAFFCSCHNIPVAMDFRQRSTFDTVANGFNYGAKDDGLETPILGRAIENCKNGEL
jgi:hypothetical protein